MTTSKFAAASFVTALALAAAACSSESEQKSAAFPAPPAGEPAAPAPAEPVAAAPAEPVSGRAGGVATATATVTAVDLATRHVTLKRDDGTKFVIVCGDEVRNLPQIKVGDILTVSYQESVAWEVKKPGEATPGAEGMAGAGRAKVGEKPAAGVGKVIRVTATIVSIDRENMYVTLKGPDGDLVTVKAMHPEKVAAVNVGDLVEITYTEAFAISVATPPGK